MENGKTSVEKIIIPQEPQDIKGERGINRGINQGINLWQWIEDNKAIALSVGLLTGMSLILTAFIVTQIHIQSKKELLQLEEHRDKVFWTLLKQLNSTVEERKTAILGKIKALGADLSFANLAQATANGGDFSQANFSNANLVEMKLSSAQLQGANLRNAELVNANLQSANLSFADLQGANLAGANFQALHLCGMIWIYAQNFFLIYQ